MSSISPSSPTASRARQAQRSGQGLGKRRQSLGDNQRMKEQFQQQLKQLQQGPADKLADALRQGDFERAVRELEKLRQELAKGGNESRAA